MKTKGWTRAHTKHFSKDENQNHADEQTGLLRSATHTCITNDPDCETGREPCEPDSQARTQLDEAGKQGGVLTQVVRDEHADHEPVDGNDTSHDDGNNVCGW